MHPAPFARVVWADEKRVEKRITSEYRLAWSLAGGHSPPCYARLMHTADHDGPRRRRWMCRARQARAMLSREVMPGASPQLVAGW